MEYQLGKWKGDFGSEYTNRNAIDWRSRINAFSFMLYRIKIKNVLEIGCNRGHNLVAMHNFYASDRVSVFGVEPNRYALKIAKKNLFNINAIEANSYYLPFKDSTFDLVITAGVLVHIPLNTLNITLKEIYRVSKNYILSIEYFSETESKINYRGEKNLLWKRNFKMHYKKLFEELKLIREGFWDKSNGFDDANWWLFKKQIEK